MISRRVVSRSRRRATHPQKRGVSIHSNSRFLAILGTMVGARVLLAATLGLGRDEAAYWYWAWHGLDASYSWVTAMLIRISTTAAGDGAWAVRAPGLLAGFATIAAVGVSARRLGASAEHSRLAALVVATSPWQTYVATVVHPDALFTLFLVLTADRLAALRLDPHRATRHAVLAATACVLAALTKLTGVILLPVVAFSLIRASLRVGTLAGSLGILAVGTAILIQSRDPRILEGMRQFGRFDAGVGGAERVALVLGGILLFGGPALVLAALGDVRRYGARLTAADPARWLAGAMVAFFAAFFALGQAKSNWFLPSLTLLVPVAAAKGRAGAGLSTTLVLALTFAGAWALPATPSVWNALVAHLPRDANESYAMQLGDRERDVSSSRSWAERVEEYHRSNDLDEAARTLSSDARVIVSNDYGLAFQLAHRLGRRRLVRLPWDPVFARTCRRELRPDADVSFVSSTWEAAPRAWADGFRESVSRGRTTGGDREIRIVEYRGWRGGSRDDHSGGSMNGCPARQNVRTFVRFAATSLACFSLSHGAATARDYDPADEVDHGSFDALLKEYVREDGVRYEAWSESGRDQQKLTDYLARLAASSPSKLTRDQQLAFWINTYNAVTLDLVLENFPIDSIKDTGSLFSSPWKKKRITIEGRELSLDAIENEILRKEFTEPRIHFALNCAARSCPPLRPGAYDGRKIDAQLEEQTTSFLGDRSQNFVDEKGRLRLSKILEWYRKDFERKGSLVDFVRPYVPELGDRTDVDVEFEGYDWALNVAS